jgi:hypothetical protein
LNETEREKKMINHAKFFVQARKNFMMLWHGQEKTCEESG